MMSKQQILSNYFGSMYYSNKNQAKKESYRALFWPLYIEENNLKEKYINFLWRVYRKRNTEKEKIVEALPWFTNHEDSAKHTFTIWPIFAQKIVDKNSGQSNWYSLIPWTKLWPVFYYDKNFENKTTRLEILWPFFTINDTPTNYSFNFRPIIWYDRADKIKSLTVFPFYWQRKNPGGSLTAFIPFFYSSKYAEGESLIIPPYYNFKTNNISEKIGLFPIFNFSSKFTAPGEKEKTLLWTVPPIYIEKTAGEKKTFVFPFFYNRSSDKEKNMILFPFISFKNEQRSLKSFIPFYLEYKDLIGHDKEKSFLWTLPPIYSKTNMNEKKMFAFPFFYNKNSGEEKNMILLNYIKLENKNRKYNAFLPFYNKYESRDMTWNLVPPFYWSNRQGDIGNEKLNIFFPIYFSWKNPKETGLVIPPVLFEKDQELKRLVIFPLIWYTRHTERHLNIFPFFTYTKKANEDKELNIFWKVLTYNKVGTEEKTKLLWKLYESKKKDNYIARSFNPLIQYEKTGEANTYFAFLWRFFSYEREQNRKRIYFLYLFHNTWE